MFGGCKGEGEVELAICWCPRRGWANKMRAILARIVRESQVDGKRKKRVDERERNSDETRESEGGTERASNERRKW
jgi:hypothetical protein